MVQPRHMEPRFDSDGAGAMRRGPILLAGRIAGTLRLVVDVWRWPVVPGAYVTRTGTCSCGDRRCPEPGSHPVDPVSWLAASSDPERVHGWWLATPLASIVMPIGWHADVLDVPERGGLAALARLEMMGYDPSPVVATASGRVLFFVAASARRPADVSHAEPAGVPHPETSLWLGGDASGAPDIVVRRRGTVMLPPLGPESPGVTRWVEPLHPERRPLPRVEDMLGPVLHACREAAVRRSRRSGRLAAAVAARTAALAGGTVPVPSGVLTGRTDSASESVLSTRRAPGRAPGTPGPSGGTAAPPGGTACSGAPAAGPVGAPSAGTSPAGTPSPGTPSPGTLSAGFRRAGPRSAGAPTPGTPSPGSLSAGVRSAGSPPAGRRSAGTSSAGFRPAGLRSAGTGSAGTPSRARPAAPVGKAAAPPAAVATGAPAGASSRAMSATLRGAAPALPATYSRPGASGSAAARRVGRGSISPAREGAASESAVAAAAATAPANLRGSARGTGLETVSDSVAAAGLAPVRAGAAASESAPRDGVAPASRTDAIPPAAAVPGSASALRSAPASGSAPVPGSAAASGSATARPVRTAPSGNGAGAARAGRPRTAAGRVRRSGPAGLRGRSAAVNPRLLEPSRARSEAPAPPAPR